MARRISRPRPLLWPPANEMEEASRMIRDNVLILCLACCSGMILPQRGLAQGIQLAVLPSAPQPQSAGGASVFQKADAQLALEAASPQTAVPAIPNDATQAAAPGTPISLTRAQAEQLALKNNPRISIGKLLALAEHQVYRETRSSELPTFSGAITAVDANEGSRIGAGGLNAPRVLEHAGAGVTLSQLITDFGRTINLVSSAKLREKAENANALANTEDIVLATDQAYYNALQAQALLKVAQQTVNTRQSVEHQIDELAKNKLKSTLDLSFAEVNLSRPSCCSWTRKTMLTPPSQRLLRFWDSTSNLPTNSGMKARSCLLLRLTWMCSSRRHCSSVPIFRHSTTLSRQQRNSGGPSATCCSPP